MTSLFTESQKRILKDIKLEFLKMNAAEDKMEPNGTAITKMAMTVHLNSSCLLIQ